MIASDIIYEDEIFLIMEPDQYQQKEQEKQKIMKEIEKKTEKRLNIAIQTKQIVDPIDLLNQRRFKLGRAILRDGAPDSNLTGNLVEESNGVPFEFFNGINNKKNIDAKEIEKTENILQNIMKQGSEEFEQKTGRQMTYGEMRAMYG